MSYLFKGFTHNAGFRVFSFEHVEKDRERIEYRVKADLSLIHKYCIRLQELPLLCRGLLDQHDANDDRNVLTYSESDMVHHAGVAAAREACKQTRHTSRIPLTPKSRSALATLQSLGE